MNAVAEGTDVNITDAFAIGVGSLGLVALAIGVALLIATIVFAKRGAIPAALICGGACLTLLLGPVIMLVIAIIVLLVTLVMGNTPYGVQFFGGWLLGTIIVVITYVALVLMGVIVGVTA